MNVNHHVFLSPAYQFSGGWRLGTGAIGAAEFERRFGSPHKRDCDGKAFNIYSIETPRGTGQVYWCWWNWECGMSINAPDDKIGLWIAKWLRGHGIEAATRGDMLKKIGQKARGADTIQELIKRGAPVS